MGSRKLPKMLRASRRLDQPSRPSLVQLALKDVSPTPIGYGSRGWAGMTNPWKQRAQQDALDNLRSGGGGGSGAALAALRAQLEVSRRARDQVEQVLAEAEAQRAALQVELDAAAELVRTRGEAYAELQNELLGAKAEKREALEALEALEAAKAEADATLAEKKEELRQAALDVDRLRADLDERLGEPSAEAQRLRFENAQNTALLNELRGRLYALENNAQQAAAEA